MRGRTAVRRIPNSASGMPTSDVRGHAKRLM
jgi:hypothetical protein